MRSPFKKNYTCFPLPSLRTEPICEFHNFK
uniref:Uncharacterized protein n=1 Tax=Anguilla anguilla TaxID=7936 RepID=A0A0E9RUC4_ANGAN